MGNNFKWVDDMLIMVDSNGQEVRPKNQRLYKVEEVVDCLDYLNINLSKTEIIKLTQDINKEVA